jgi:hypothetical protein
MVTFIQRVTLQRRRTAVFLITMIDSYRLLERYATTLERNRMVASINKMITRYDKLTRIEHRLQLK